MTCKNALEGGWLDPSLSYLLLGNPAQIHPDTTSSDQAVFDGYTYTIDSRMTEQGRSPLQDPSYTSLHPLGSSPDHHNSRSTGMSIPRSSPPSHSAPKNEGLSKKRERAVKACQACHD